METDRKVDLAAVGRIARCVDLRDIRLTEVNATSATRAYGVLEPDLDHECEANKLENPNLVEVVCRYHFKIKTGEAEIASANFSYAILYEVAAGEEAVLEQDLGDFAYANGTYHSWPFVRQLLFDLTARMGYPPYSLPVLKFNPKNSTKPAAAPVETTTAEAS